MKSKLLGWPFFLLTLFLVKGSLLWLDHHPKFFLGDSASYICTALTGWIPPDRSFVYGYFIRLFAVTTHSLLPLVIVQTCLGAVSAVVLAHILIRYFNVKHWTAFLAAILINFEPVQLLYEKYVLTETLSLTVFSLYIWTVLHYMEDSRIRWLWLVQGLATLLISIRLAFLPMVWICSITVPLLAAPNIIGGLNLSAKKTVSRLAINLVASVLILSLFTSAYRHLNGYLSRKPPAYSYTGGAFALAFVLPIVEPDDFENKILGTNVLNSLHFPQTDRRLRDEQRWSEGGVISQLEKFSRDDLEANAIASQTAFQAVTRRPFKFLGLAWATFTDYFDRPYLEICIETDVGDEELEPQFQELVSKQFHYPENRSSMIDLKTITGKLFLHSAWWYRFLLLLPFWTLLCMTPFDYSHRNRALLIFLLNAISVGVLIFLVNRPIVRYLHNSAWLFFLIMGVGLNRVANLLNNNFKNH